MKKRIIIGTLSICLAAVILAGCGTDNSGADASVTREMAVADYAWDEAEVDYDDYISYTNPATSAGGYDAYDMGWNPGTGGEMQAGESQKIAHTYSLSLQTREFDQGISWIEALVEENGGLIQDSYIQGVSMYDSVGYRYASYTLRMPSDGISSTLQAFEGQFNITDRSHYQDNITAQYYDTQSRLNALLIQRDKLMALLEDAEDVATLLEIERELSNVLYQIDSWQTSLNYMDDRVDYTTINLYLEEVVEYSSIDPQPTSFQSELALAVKSSWLSFRYFCKDVVFGIIHAVPYLIAAAVAILILIGIRKSRKKKANLAKEKNSTPADE